MTNNIRRGSTSALSIDWEVYELFNEFVSSGGTDENDAMMMMGGPMYDDELPHRNTNANANTNVNSVPQPRPDYRTTLVRQQHLEPHEESPELAIPMDSHDIFQV
jgi:hypothetical protein